MNVYEYTAITTDKKRIQGLLWADSEDEVSTKLKLEGYVICSIARSSSKSVRWNHKQVYHSISTGIITTIRYFP
jgi:type IV pilus assembly protein PilC